jgi:hypothetical protein
VLAVVRWRPTLNRLYVAACMDRNRCARLGSRRADPPCDVRPEWIDPTADRLIRHIDPSFSQDILDISQTKCELQIKPDCAPDDVEWEAIAAVADLAPPPKLSTFRTNVPTNLISPLTPL